MSVHPSSEEEAIKLEDRAHQLKKAMLNDAEFMAGIRRGYEQEQRGELMTWAELRQAIGRG